MPAGSDDLLLALALSMYGGTMVQVQLFEQSLASLVAVANIGKHWSRGWQRDMERLIRANLHRFNKASASELINLLEETDLELAEPLASNIKSLVGWRDFLAHRYLRYWFVNPGPPMTTRIDTETLAELNELSKAFNETSERIRGEMQRILAERPPRNADVPEGVREIMSQVAIRMMRPPVPRFKRIAPTEPPPDQDDASESEVTSAPEDGPGSAL